MSCLTLLLDRSRRLTVGAQEMDCQAFEKYPCPSGCGKSWTGYTNTTSGNYRLLDEINHPCGAARQGQTCDATVAYFFNALVKDCVECCIAVGDPCVPDEECCCGDAVCAQQSQP
jgi:hypothetical protein